MKSLITSFALIISRKDSRLVIIITTLVFLFLLLLSQNGNAAFEIITFGSIPILTKVQLFFSTFFDIGNSFNTSSIILAVLGSLIGGINVALAYTYMKERGSMIRRSGLYSGVGLFFAFLGIGCAACGTALLSFVLGLLGFSTMLSLLPYNGEEIGYIGLLILCVATYSLSQKVSAPNVC